MYRTSSAGTVVLTAALASTPAQSPAAAQVEDRYRIDEEVVVSATRVERNRASLPHTTTVIDAAELAADLAIETDISALIGRHVPSFSPSRQKLSSAGETLRGREPLYLIDGVPQSNPLRDGSRDGYTIDPALIERVEVIHGSNAIQGLGASGGIIALVTRQPRPGEPAFHELEAALTSADDLEGDATEYRARYTGGAAGERLSGLFSVSVHERGIYLDADGDPIGVDNTQGDLADSFSRDAFVKTRYEVTEAQRLTFMLNDFELEGHGDWLNVAGDREGGVPTSSERGDLPGDAPENDVTTASLRWQHDKLLGGRVDVSLYLQDFEATYGGGVFGTFQDPAIAPEGSLFDQSRNVSEKRGARFTWAGDDLLSAGISVVAGFDVLRDETRQELAQTGRAWVPETRFNNMAPFVQGDWSYGAVDLSAGVRHERAELDVDDFRTLASYGAPLVEGGKPDFDETLVNAGVVFAASDQVSLFASFSEGFTMPDVGRVLRGIDTPDTSVEDFLDLQPVVSDNLELGVRWQGERAGARLAWFASDSDLGQRLSPNDDGIFTVNREKTEIEGVEASGEWNITEAVRLEARYAHLEGEFDSDGDGQVDTDLPGINIAPDRLNLAIQTQLPKRISARLDLTRTFDRDFDGPGAADADFDGYLLVDGLVTLASSLGDFRLGVANLLDEDYVTYYSQVYEFAGDTRYFTGRGRTLTLSWQREF